jgi:hypothetical protein
MSNEETAATPIDLLTEWKKQGHSPDTTLWEPSEDSTDECPLDPWALVDNRGAKWDANIHFRDFQYSPEWWAAIWPELVVSNGRARCLLFWAEWSSCAAQRSDALKTRLARNEDLLAAAEIYAFQTVGEKGVRSKRVIELIDDAIRNGKPSVFTHLAEMVREGSSDIEGVAALADNLCYRALKAFHELLLSHRKLPTKRIVDTALDTAPRRARSARKSVGLSALPRTMSQRGPKAI